MGLMFVLVNIIAVLLKEGQKVLKNIEHLDYLAIKW